MRTYQFFIFYRLFRTWRKGRHTVGLSLIMATTCVCGFVLLIAEAVNANGLPNCEAELGSFYPSYGQCTEDGHVSGANHECTYRSGTDTATASIWKSFTVGTLSPSIVQERCNDWVDGLYNEGYRASPGCQSAASGYVVRVIKQLNTACAVGGLDETGTFCQKPELTENCNCSIDSNPIDVLSGLGYETCDRPAAQQCTDGSYLLTTDTCAPPCDSLTSCTQDACANESSNCLEGTTITSVNFDVSTGDNGFSCGSGGSYCELFNTQPENNCDSYGTCLVDACNTGCGAGLYVDGFIYGSGSNYANSCSTGGNVCGDNPGGNTDQDVSGNGEPYQDVNDTGTGNTDVAAAVNEAAERQSQTSQVISNNIITSTTNIIEALAESSESGDQNSAAIVASNDRIKAVNEVGFKGLQTTLEEFTDTETPIDVGFYSLIKDAPILAAAGQFTEIFDTGNGTCPTFTLNLEMFNGSFSSDIHCQIYDDNIGVLQAIFAIVYAFLGFRIIASA